MAETLLRTKLFVPPLRANLVRRPHLIERLNQGVQPGHKLTLVSASAGFGKTTLVSQWVHQCRCPVAWLSLDDGDNDLARFLTYLVAALQTIDSNRAHGVLATLQTPGIPNAEMALTALLNEMAELPDDAVLIFDDYHVIESLPIDEAISFLLEHLPPKLHLMIVGRIDPSIPLSRLRASSQMTEIRVDDLRFTPEETSSFLNQVTDFRLSTQEIAALEVRTEGWIAGLQLAALSMQNSDDLTGFVRSFTGDDRYILDYFGEEVLSRQSREVQSFLLQTSILDRLTGPLCDAITGNGDGQEMLEILERDNLFVVPLDNERCWYRYHHLFADLLQARLKRFHLDRVEELHLRVSRWFEEQGSMAEAVDHAFSAKDYDRAASLIEQNAGETMLQGHLTTILRWLDALPDSVLDSRPRLRFYQARALSLAGQSRMAEELAADAKSTLDQLPDSPENRALRGELAALLTGIIVYRYDPPRVIQEAEEALTYLPKDELNSRARVHIALGTAYAYSGELQKALKTYEQTMEMALLAENPFLATAANDMFSEIQIYHMGRLKESAQSLPQIVELGRISDGTLQPYAGTSHILLAEINLEWNDLKTASSYMAKGLELLRQGGIGYSLIHSYCAKSRLELATGRVERAVESLHSATQAARSYPLMQMLMHNLAYQVKTALHLGDSETAQRWAMGEECELPEKLPIYLREVQQIALAQVYLAQGEPEKAINTLDQILPWAESSGRMAHVIDIYLLKALALQEQGETSAAVECLTSALSLAVPEGYVRTFLEHGAPMARLLTAAASRDVMPDYTTVLLSAFGAEEQSEAMVSSQPLIEPLSPRELEVLQLIADGFTNREISEKLVLALDTVKGHNYRIFSKLGVKNRTQAIKTAVSLKILHPQ
jgi:LuxR family maltose regulon positive regulatory protein